MKSVLTALALIVVLAIASGCGSYYKVSDPSTGKTYYTEKIDKKGGGAIQFKDAKTGGKVTVQNSEVIKVNKETFRAGVGE